MRPERRSPVEANTSVTSLPYLYEGGLILDPYLTAFDIYGTANNTSVMQGSVIVEVGGVANGVAVAASFSSNNAQSLIVRGQASNIAVGSGSVTIDTTGSVTDANISPGATLQIYSGGTLTAQLGIIDAGLVRNSGLISVPGYSGVNQTSVLNVAGTQLSVTGGGLLLNGGTVDVGAGAQGGAGYLPGAGGTLTVSS